MAAFLLLLLFSRFSFKESSDELRMNGRRIKKRDLGRGRDKAGYTAKSLADGQGH